MAVTAIRPGYTGEVMDKQANYGDKILVFIGWDEHLLFCSAKAFPLPPAMTFKDFKAGVLPEGFNQHPDFEHIKWGEVEWNLNGEMITPTDEQTLEELGFDHKSLLRFKTPGLNGWKGTGV